METGIDAQRYLEQTKRAKELLGQLGSEETVDGQEIFHEVYVVGEVKDWHPKDQGDQHVGYGISPMDNPLGPEANGRPAETVSSDDIGGVKPCPFDILHVQRLGSWAGPRISIEIIR